MYFGLVSVSVGQILFELFCPKHVKRYPNATICASEEFDFLTEDDYYSFAQSHPALHDDVMEVKGLSSSLGVAMELRLEEDRSLARYTRSVENGGLDQNSPDWNSLLQDSKTDTADPRVIDHSIDEYSRQFREQRVKVIKRVYALENQNFQLFLVPTLLLFGFGILLLALPAIDTFIQVVKNLSAIELPFT